MSFVPFWDSLGRHRFARLGGIQDQLFRIEVQPFAISPLTVSTVIVSSGHSSDE